MRPWLVLPVKPVQQGKSRLAPHVGAVARRALMATFTPVIARCVFGLRYIEYSSRADARSVTDCLITLDTVAPFDH